MENCYRSMPKLVGAVFEAIYQHPTTSLIAIAALATLIGAWGYKASQKAQQ